MTTALRWCLVLGLSVAACEEAGNTPADVAPADAPVDDDTPAPPTDSPTADAPRDASDAGPRPMFAPCTSRTQCGGSGTICTTLSEGYPGGLCTRACMRDSDCGDTGICWPFGGGMRCIPRCTTVSDCREGYQCQGITGRDDRACFPFCTADSQCAPMTCNTWARTCRSVDTRLAENGAPCEASAECRSNRCTREINTDGTPSGNLDGICISLCTVPADSAYAGSTLPRSDCPMNSVCPRDSTTMAGGIGICRVECRTNDNCRPGYICVHPSRPGADAGTYENGYCAAMNCHYMTQMCPPIATCRTTRTDDAGVATSGICVRNDTDGGDATVDATSDATSDAASDAGDVTDASDATADAAG